MGGIDSILRNATLIEIGKLLTVFLSRFSGVPRLSPFVAGIKLMKRFHYL